VCVCVTLFSYISQALDSQALADLRKVLCLAPHLASMINGRKSPHPVSQPLEADDDASEGKVAFMAAVDRIAGGDEDGGGRGEGRGGDVVMQRELRWSINRTGNSTRTTRFSSSN
jgi:hypothetical protein